MRFAHGWRTVLESGYRLVPQGGDLETHQRMPKLILDRIRDLLGNVLFPLALREQPDQWENFLDLPGSGDNESLRRATLRLFGEDHPDAAKYRRKYWQQQGLLQIYRDFCLEDTSECADCPFPEQLGQWE